MTGPQPVVAKSFLPNWPIRCSPTSTWSIFAPGNRACPAGPGCRGGRASELDRWPRFGPKAHKSGFAAVHALPMRLREQVIGGMNLFTAAR